MKVNGLMELKMEEESIMNQTLELHIMVNGKMEKNMVSES